MGAICCFGDLNHFSIAYLTIPLTSHAYLKKRDKQKITIYMEI